ncbi:hypothetical protein [Archangium sp.]|uniref:hypothetical protein n=1 Tax=Archangium sp. TaxID=1872627 RepID=UPI002D30A5F5|nr:hypothetical protein [Archangium sp.]HYO58193.1 hypothetical protein [Archangium sp.]
MKMKLASAIGVLALVTGGAAYANTWSGEVDIAAIEASDTGMGGVSGFASPRSHSLSTPARTEAANTGWVEVRITSNK